MISLVVCSIKSNYLTALKENVDEMIGVEHEWLVWDNRTATLGLTAVYNKMAAFAKFPYICFLHEDILIQTRNWGKLLIDICEKQQVSLVGVAGSKYKSKFFSGWYSGGKNLDYYHINHRGETVDNILSWPEVWPSNEVEVACIDGVFMFSTSLAWHQIKFDEKLLTGFHFYDIDYSFRVATNNKVVVTNQLDIIHFSTIGDFSDTWIEHAINWHKVMQNKLPFSVVKNNEPGTEVVVAKYWLDWLKNMNVSFSHKQEWIRLQNLYKHPALWYSLGKFLFYKPLRLKRLHHFIINKRQH